MISINTFTAIEPILNGICYSIEIIALAYGIPQIVIGIQAYKDGLQRIRVQGTLHRSSGLGRIGLGIALIVLGILIPSVANWVIASNIEPGAVSYNRPVSFKWTSSLSRNGTCPGFIFVRAVS